MSRGAALLAGLALVVLAGASSALFGDRTGPEGAPTPLLGRVLFDVAVGAAVASVVFAVALAAWALATGRGGGGRPPARRKRGLLELLVLVAVLLAAAGALSRLQPIDDGTSARREPPPGAPADAVDDRDGGPTTPATDFAIIGAVATALLAGVLVALLRRRPRPVAARSTVATPVADAAASAAIDLRAETDPRRAVVAAYLRMDRTLADHGLGRRPSEAPLEHLGRVLGDAGIPVGPAHRLVELFERARFSSHPVDAATRAEALAHLEAVRDHLGAVPA